MKKSFLHINMDEDNQNQGRLSKRNTRGCKFERGQIKNIEN